MTEIVKETTEENNGTEQRKGEFQFPIDLLPMHLQNEFYDKFSFVELRILTGRSAWKIIPSSLERKVMRYCAFRYYRILCQHANMENKMITIPNLFISREKWRTVQIWFHPDGKHDESVVKQYSNPFTVAFYIPWSILSEFLKKFGYVIKKIYLEKITQNTFNWLKSHLKPFGCHIPEINLTVFNHITDVVREEYEHAPELEDILQHFSVKAFSHCGKIKMLNFDFIQKIDILGLCFIKYSTSDLLSFKGSYLKIDADSISSETCLELLKAPPTTERPLRKLRIMNSDKKMIGQVIREGSLRHENTENEEFLLDFGSDETQWLCRAQYYSGFFESNPWLLKATFEYVPIVL